VLDTVPTSFTASQRVRRSRSAVLALIRVVRVRLDTVTTHDFAARSSYLLSLDSSFRTALAWPALDVAIAISKERMQRSQSILRNRYFLCNHIVTVVYCDNFNLERRRLFGVGEPSTSLWYDFLSFLLRCRLTTSVYSGFVRFSGVTSPNFLHAEQGPSYSIYHLDYALRWL
jgi:hypothetical protein